jgi:flagellar biosynthesis/type III secretory pathway M-ring protein FliF/YscJ
MKLLSLLFLLCTVAANAQLSEKQLKELHDNTAKIESTTAKLNESINASIHRTDSMNMVRFNEQNTRNLDAFMAARKEQERKTTQRIYWRLGFGVLMLIVLIVGWRRKKKVKAL